MFKIKITWNIEGEFMILIRSVSDIDLVQTVHYKKEPKQLMGAVKYGVSVCD